MCGKVTPVILHGVVSPENATFRSVLLAGCALFGAAQLRVLSMSGITQLLVVSTSGVCLLRRRWLGVEVLEALGHGQLRCSCVRIEGLEFGVYLRVWD